MGSAIPSLLPTGDDWVVKSLVSVKYPKDDLVGMFFAYYSLIVYEVQAVYITLFLRNRDMLTFYCCFTHMISEIITYFLKHYLKHGRPEDGPPLGGGLFEGRYGMPSQHCHCFAYLITTLMLLVFHYYSRYISPRKKNLVAVMSVIALTLQVSGRIYLKYHTITQCLVGALFGSMSALCFYALGISLFLPYSKNICRLSLLRFFSFKRDLVTPPPTKHEECHSNTKRQFQSRKNE